MPQEQETLQRVKGFGVPSHKEGGQPVCLQTAKAGWFLDMDIPSLHAMSSLPKQKAKIDLGYD